MIIVFRSSDWKPIRTDAAPHPYGVAGHGETALMLQNWPPVNLYACAPVDGLCCEENENNSRGNAVAAIRARAAIRQGPLDIKEQVAREQLTLNMADEGLIERWYAVMLLRERIRRASNAAQELAGFVPLADAWAAVDSWSEHDVPAVELGMIISNMAMISRLALTPDQMQHPVVVMMQPIMLAAKFVDLCSPETAARLQVLVDAGIKTQNEINAAISAPITWAERMPLPF